MLSPFASFLFLFNFCYLYHFSKNIVQQLNKIFNPQEKKSVLLTYFSFFSIAHCIDFL